MKKLRVIFFTETEEGACAKYRAWIPCIGLDYAGHYARYSTEWQPRMKNEFDVFVFQRNSVKPTINLIYSLRMQGKTVVYDLDDDLLNIPPSNPVFWAYLNNAERPWVQLQSARWASCISVTTPQLQKLYSCVNDKVRVIPNWINIEEHKDVPPIRVAKGALLFWGGSNTHRGCLMILKDVLPTIFKKYPHVKMVVMGDNLPFEVDWDRIIQVPWGKYRFFQMIERGCDIGLAPLAPCKFNLGKSDLRIKELALSLIHI